MEDLTKNWSNLTLYEKEDTGFTLPRVQQLKEYIIAATFLISHYLVMEPVIRTLKHLWRLKNGFEIRNVERITKNQLWSIDKHLAIIQKFDESMKFHELAFDREENKSQTLRQAAETEGGSPKVGNPLSAEMEKMTARVCIEEEKGINDGPVTNKEQTAEVDK